VLFATVSDAMKRANIDDSRDAEKGRGRKGCASAQRCRYRDRSQPAWRRAEAEGTAQSNLAKRRERRGIESRERYKRGARKQRRGKKRGELGQRLRLRVRRTCRARA
jgi:hypothetical protein